MFSNSQSVYFRSSFVASSTTVPRVQGEGEIARPWASPVRAASHSKKKKEGHHREETDQHRIHRRRPVHLLVESEQLIFGGSRWPSARGLSDVAETCDAGVTWRGS